MSITLEKMKTLPQDNFPEVVIVHSIGGSKLNPLADTSNHTFKGVQDHHISLGWENFGYHWFISKNGIETEGRPEHYHGAHTTDWNYKSIGICLSGNFDATLPTKEQEITLARRLTAIRANYPNIPIEPHRKYAKTKKSCYGKLLSDDYARNLLIAPVDTKSILLKRIEELTELVKQL